MKEQLTGLSGIRKLTTGLLLTAAFLGGCEKQVADDHAASHDDHASHWGYEGKVGPEYWADLDDDYWLCRSGEMQSPVDLNGAVPLEKAGIEGFIESSVLSQVQRNRVMDLVDNGHTIQITNEQPLSVKFGGKTYELVQYHLHAPSEHTIDGRHSPLEVHFVHKSSDGELAVIGILIEEGEFNPHWQPIVESLPDHMGEVRHVVGLNLDMTKLRSIQKPYYRYEGSLTTPPCSEGVHWIVKKRKHQMSTEQLVEIITHLHKNNRPVQALGERRIGIVEEE